MANSEAKYYCIELRENNTLVHPAIFKSTALIIASNLKASTVVVDEEEFAAKFPTLFKAYEEHRNANS